MSYIKEEFDIAYSALCDKLYKPGGIRYKRFRGSSKEAEDIFEDLRELKSIIDGEMKFSIKEIYRKVK